MQVNKQGDGTILIAMGRGKIFFYYFLRMISKSRNLIEKKFQINDVNNKKKRNEIILNIDGSLMFFP